MGKSADNAGDLGVVDDVFGGVGSKCLVERDRVEGLRGQAKIYHQSMLVSQYPRGSQERLSGRK